MKRAAAVMRHPDLESVIESKRRYPTLDGLVSDSQLNEHLWRDGVELDDGKPLTLVRALYSAHRVPDFLPVAAALESQLSALAPLVARGRRGRFTKQLLNGPQFLNALSELALAMRLQIEGWGVELASPFHDNAKDVDIRANRGPAIRFVEVANLAPESAAELVEGFMEKPGGQPLDRRLVGKVVSKYKAKFEKAIEEGWVGDVWIAIDFGKQHDLSLDLRFRRPLTRHDWRKGAAAELHATCPGLRGVVYYQSTAVHPCADEIEWTPTSQT